MWSRHALKKCVARHTRLSTIRIGVPRHARPSSTIRFSSNPIRLFSVDTSASILTTILPEEVLKALESPQDDAGLEKAVESASKLLEFSKDPAPRHRTLVLETWRKLVCSNPKIKGIPQRAQRILPSDDVTIEEFNHVLACWAYSREYMRGAMADRVFLEIPNPNDESYRLIVQAWCRSEVRGQSAFMATQRLQQWYRDRDNVTGPALEDYHAVLKKWSLSKHKNAVARVEGLLDQMENAYSDRSSLVRPDLVCYQYALETAASPRRMELHVESVVDKYLRRLKDRYMIPNTACYRAAICAYMNQARVGNPDLRDSRADRAVELLHEMNVAHLRTTTIEVKSSLEDYNNVLRALSLTGKHTARIEQLLEEMDETNFTSYVLGLISLRADPHQRNRLSRGKALLQRMKETVDRSDKYVPKESLWESETPVDACNVFLQICTAPRSSIQELQIGLETIEEMRGWWNFLPTSTTFHILLDACNNLLYGRERSVMVEKIFGMCCKYGLVDRRVLKDLRENHDLFLKLAVAKCRDLAGQKVVPEEWQRNVEGKKFVTSEGFKPRPITIDGKTLTTKDIKEYKMRNLRVGRGKRLLRGGRLSPEQLREISRTER